MTQTVKVEDGPQLTTKSKTVNAVKEKGVWMVNTDSVLVSVQVKNIGTVDYDDDVLIYLFKMYNEKSGNCVAIAKTPIQLAAGADTTVVMQIDGLEDEAKYFYNVYFMVGPKVVISSQSDIIFTVNLKEPDGIQFVGNDAVNGNVVIYGMNGSKVAEVKGRDVRQYLTTLPKGLYIIRSRQRSWTVRN